MSDGDERRRIVRLSFLQVCLQAAWCQRACVIFHADVPSDTLMCQSHKVILCHGAVELFDHKPHVSNGGARVQRVQLWDASTNVPRRELTLCQPWLRFSWRLLSTGRATFLLLYFYFEETQTPPLCCLNMWDGLSLWEDAFCFQLTICR